MTEHSRPALTEVGDNGPARERERWVPRCWQTRLRDRLAWRLFKRIAHPAVASTAWDHYRWGRDCESVQWTSKGGAHAHYKVGA